MIWIDDAYDPTSTSNFIRSVSTLCCGWQPLRALATMSLLDCCHWLSSWLPFLMGARECLVSIVPAGVSMVSELHIRKREGFVRLECENICIIYFSHIIMCKAFFGRFSSFACDCMQPWQKSWHSLLSKSCSLISCFQAPSTCHLPHCDHHVALLLCGFYDVPSLLGPKTWSRASFGHWFGLCSCQGDSSLISKSIAEMRKTCASNASSSARVLESLENHGKLLETS